MIRARFYVNPDDYRPVIFPPPGPYWCSGYQIGQDFEETAAIIVAFVEREEQITEFWPDAREIDSQGEKEMVFTDRFPRPNWWTSP